MCARQWQKLPTEMLAGSLRGGRVTMYRRVGRGAQTPGRRMAGGGLGGAGGGRGVAGEEEGGGSLLAPCPSSSLSSSTKEKQKRQERMSADDNNNDGGSGRCLRQHWRWGGPSRTSSLASSSFSVVAREGGEERARGLETVAMHTPAAARTTAKPQVGGSGDGLR